MLVSAHHGERVADIGKLEGLVDRQRQLAGLDGRPEVGAQQPVDFAKLLDAASTEGHSDIVDALERMLVEIELALHAAEPADIDDAAEDRRRFEIAVDEVAGNEIDDQVDALAAGMFPDLLRP